MPERFKVVLDHARRYTSARLYLYLLHTDTEMTAEKCTDRHRHTQTYKTDRQTDQQRDVSEWMLSWS